MQAMPKGHPLPFRLLSACFGKRGASSTVAGVSAPEAQRAGQQPALCTAVFLHFWESGTWLRHERVIPAC